MLIFVDGFSHYTQPFMAEKWDVVNTGSNATTSAQSVSGVGRSGGGGITFAGSDATGGASGPPGDSQFIQKNYDGVGTIICGMALQQTMTQIAGNVNVGSGARWLTFMSGATIQVALHILPSGQIRALRNLNIGDGFYVNTFTDPKVTILGTSTRAISSSSFDFLEVKVIHNSSTGSVEIKRNGAAFWTLSNVNTDMAGTGNSSTVIVGGAAVLIGGSSYRFGLNAVVTDFHLLNTTVNGSDAFDPVDFIGDRHWEVVLPTADATYTQWTPDPSANHWENVDEIPPDGASSTNSTSTVGNKDSMIFQTLAGPTTASVLLSYTMYSQKNTGGAVGVKGLMRSPAGIGGTDGTGTEYQVPNPYAFRQSFLCTDPATSGELTVAIVNAGEHGYTRSS